jgi:hypothetical protein
MTAAANALFATSDVVQIRAMDESNPEQRAAAALNKELLNYRLDTAHRNQAVPWFMISMGACQTATIAGICVSKQYWEVKQEATGRQVMDPQTGEITPEKRKVYSRPVIQLYPPENVIRDPGAPWINQVAGSYLGLRNAISIGDLKALIEASQGTPFQMRRAEVAEMRSAINDYNSAGVRRAREQGNDRMTDAQSQGITDFEMCWLTELFCRKDGQEYVWWVLGEDVIISEPSPLKDIYPWTGGLQRPVQIGISSIDAFKIDPMSPVESWKPLQAEINDMVNLSLDNLKQNMSPITKAIRGRGLSASALQNKSPDNILFVTDKDDVTFDRPPPLGQDTFVGMDRLNADFDDLAGVFSGGSVATNRQLNETVGGMQLLSSSANAMGEFDLRVWIETWVEPVLRDMVALVQYYEDDPTILAIAGQKAQLVKKFGVSNINDQMIETPVTTKVNVGIGAADPMQRIQKLTTVNTSMAQAFGDMFTQQANIGNIAEEMYGAAGFNDGRERFLRPDADQDTRLVMAQQQIQELTKQVEDRQGDWDNKTELGRISAAQAILLKEMDAAQEVVGAVVDEKRAGLQHGRDMQSKQFDRKAQMDDKQFDRHAAKEDQKTERGAALQDRALDVGQGIVDRKQDRKAAVEDRNANHDNALEIAKEKVDAKAKQIGGAQGGKARGSSPAPKTQQTAQVEKIGRKIIDFIRDPKTQRIIQAIERHE